MCERLRRLEWVYERTPIYFVTACTNQRRAILADPHVHNELLAFGRTGPERGAWLGSYVLMPDHIHAFVALDDEQITLADWMKSLKTLFRNRCETNASKRLIGRKAFSITCCAAANRMRESGGTFAKIRCALVS
jgi:putative transposase